MSLKKGREWGALWNEERWSFGKEEYGEKLKKKWVKNKDNED